MSDEKCAKCQETLQPGALSCWACGELTPAGRKAKGANEDDDEVWRQSVEAARRRQVEAPAVDPDEALRRALAASGTEPPRAAPAPSRPAVPHPARAAKVSDEAETMGTLGMLFAVLFALAGVLVVVTCILSLTGTLAALVAMVAIVLFGTLSLAVHYAFRALSGMMTTTAAAAEDARRALNLLREQSQSQPREQ